MAKAVYSSRVSPAPTAYADAIESLQMGTVDEKPDANLHGDSKKRKSTTQSTNMGILDILSGQEKPKNKNQAESLDEPKKRKSKSKISGPFQKDKQKSRGKPPEPGMKIVQITCITKQNLIS